MLWLLDANVVITAHNLYYPIDRVPEYWDWLAYMANRGAVKMPLEIYEEVKDGPKDADPVYAWLNLHKNALVLDEGPDTSLLQKVLDQGYAPDLTDNELEEMGRDPFLIAYAMVSPQRGVVSAEVSKPKKQRQNRKVPDVCKTMGVKCCTPYELNRHLDFRTQWKKSV